MIPTIISEGKAFNKMQVVHNELYHHLLKNMWDLLVEGLARFAPGEHSRRLFTTTAKTPAKKSCLGEKASTTLRHHQGGADVTNTC